MSGYHVTYRWHWPGTPGGYEPKVAAQVLADIASRRYHKPGKPPPGAKKPKRPAGLRLPSAGRSLIGLSSKANEAVAAYEKRGLEMIAARKARQEQKQKLKKAA